MGVEKDFPRDKSIVKLSVDQIVNVSPAVSGVRSARNKLTNNPVESAEDRRLYRRSEGDDTRVLLDRDQREEPTRCAPSHLARSRSRSTETTALYVLFTTYRSTTCNLVSSPRFHSHTVLLRIGAYVDWESETECFDSLASELSFFYSPHPFLHSHSLHSQTEADKSKESNLIKNVLFPAFRQYLVPSDQLVTGKRKGREGTETGLDGDEEEVGEKDAIVLITRLESLYKVFERC